MIIIDYEDPDIVSDSARPLQDLLFSCSRPIIVNLNMFALHALQDCGLLRSNEFKSSGLVDIQVRDSGPAPTVGRSALLCYPPLSRLE